MTNGAMKARTSKSSTSTFKQTEHRRFFVVDVSKHDQPQATLIEFQEEGTAVARRTTEVAVSFGEDRDRRLIPDHSHLQSVGRLWVGVLEVCVERMWLPHVVPFDVLAGVQKMGLPSLGSPVQQYRVEANSEAFNLIGQFEQPQRSEQPSWPHPVVAGGRLYLRDADILLCYELREVPQR